MKNFISVLTGIFNKPKGYLKPVTLEIVDWNMDTNAAYALAHGLGADYERVRGVDVIIRTDGRASYYNMQGECTSVFNEKVQAGIANIDDTNVNLYRVTAEHFDSVNFDSVGGFVRGWVTLWLQY